MKKFLYSLMALTVMTLMSVGLTSCGDDNDSGNNGNNSPAKLTVKVGDYTYKASYAYWYYFSPEGETPEYRICFYDCDMANAFDTGKIPAKADEIFISIRDSEKKGSNKDLTTGTVSESYSFKVRMSKLVNGRMTNACENHFTKDSKSSLTITKSGNGYTVSVNGTDLYDEDDEVTLIQPDVSFSYTGAITYKYLSRIPSI